MINEVKGALSIYRQKWQLLTDDLKQTKKFQALSPIAVGWKVEDKTEFDLRLNALQPLCDQIHLAWLNERWLATLHLKSSTELGVPIIKLMQRRPGSTDAVGLDHLDFLFAGSESELKKLVQVEPTLTWSEEQNNPHCKWISIWFADTEAKLRTSTVLDVCIAELKEVNQTIIDRS